MLNLFTSQPKTGPEAINEAIGQFEAIAARIESGVADNRSTIGSNLDTIIQLESENKALDDTAIRNEYPERVIEVVDELTNRKHDPRVDRKSRKSLDREHFRRVGRWAKLIKLVDRLDNIRDMDGAEAGFKSLYIQESLLLANVLFDYTDPVNKRLYLELMVEIANRVL